MLRFHICSDEEYVCHIAYSDSKQKEYESFSETISAKEDVFVTGYVHCKGSNSTVPLHSIKNAPGAMEEMEKMLLDYVNIERKYSLCGYGEQQIFASRQLAREGLKAMASKLREDGPHDFVSVGRDTAAFEGQYGRIGLRIENIDTKY